MHCNNCPKVDCPQYVNAHCVIYTGPNLSNLGLTTNLRLDEILQQLSIVLGGSGLVLVTDSTPTITISGAGTAQSHLKASLNVGSVDNTITTLLGWDGTQVKQVNIPQGVGTTLITNNTWVTNLWETLITNNSYITDISNTLITNNTFVTNIINTVADSFINTQTLHFSYDSVNHIVTGNVQVSTFDNNQIQLKTDGLYIAPFLDEKARVSANDTVSGYLGTKIIGGSNVSVTELNDGNNEVLRISASFTETDPAALGTRITVNAGTGITINQPAGQLLSTPPIWTINHADTSSVINLDTTGAQVIDQVNFDGFGHVTAITTRVLTLSDIGYTAPVESDPVFTSSFVYGISSIGAGLQLSSGVLSSTITQYTDALARLSISAGTGISYNSTTGVIANTAPDQIVTITAGSNVTVSGSYPNFTISASGGDITNNFIEVRFRVAPEDDGAIGFTLMDCSGNPLTGKKINFYLERYRLYPDDDYSYDPASAAITLTNSLISGQRILIEAYPQTDWTVCDLTSSTT